MQEEETGAQSDRSRNMTSTTENGSLSSYSDMPFLSSSFSLLLYFISIHPSVNLLNESLVLHRHVNFHVSSFNKVRNTTAVILRKKSQLL